MLQNKLQFILQRLFSDVATCQFTYPHRYLEYKHQGHWYDFKTRGATTTENVCRVLYLVNT